MTVDDFIRRLVAELPGERTLDLSPDERAALLDMARLAAHASERIAAPLAAFLVGVAMADLPAGERSRPMRQLIARLEEVTAGEADG